MFSALQAKYDKCCRVDDDWIGLTKPYDDVSCVLKRNGGGEAINPHSVLGLTFKNILLGRLAGLTKSLPPKTWN
jgi:hypothetical protein